MIKKILNTQTKSIGHASLILAVFYVMSALLGLWRDHLLAARVGTQSLDMYYAAFTIPDLLGLLMIFGAISAAIIPMFTSYLQSSSDEAWQYANALLQVFLICLIIAAGISILLAPWLVTWITPGFSPEKQATTVVLMRLLFLSPIILGISNIASGILQVFHRFLVTALAPVVYNAGIIFGIIFFFPYFGLQGLAFGVLLGAFLHLAIQIPAFFYSGFRYTPVVNFWHPGVIKTLRLMIPRSLGLGAGQINTIITTTIASTLSAGSIGIFTLANNLSNMLVSMLGVSLSTAMFPVLSREWLKENKAEFRQQFSQAFLQLLFFAIPASVGIFLLRAQVVRVVLGSGRFNWQDTRLTAACLGLFAIGICFQALIVFLSKTFYAAHNTRIPALASVGTVALNIVLSFYFVRLINARGVFYSLIQGALKLQGIEDVGVLGLVLAFSLTGIIEVVILLYLLQQKYRVFMMRPLCISLAKMIGAATIMAVVILIIRQGIVALNLVALQTFWGVAFQLGFSTLSGALAYLQVSAILKSTEWESMKVIFKKNENKSY